MRYGTLLNQQEDSFGFHEEVKEVNKTKISEILVVLLLLVFLFLPATSSGFESGDWTINEYADDWTIAQEWNIYGDAYSLTLTVTNPQNISYNTYSVPVEMSTSGTDTNPVVTYNFQFSNGTWLYGVNQTYVAPTYMVFNENCTGTFYGMAVGDHASDSKNVSLTVQKTIIYTLSVAITNPQNTTYIDPAIPVELTSSGNDTNQVVTYNFQFSNSTLLYSSNQTYAGATTMTVNGDCTGTFYAYITGDNEDNSSSVMLTADVRINVNLTSSVGGSTIPTEGQYYWLKNSLYTLRAAHADYCVFYAWEIDGVNYTVSPVYYLQTVEADHTAKAYFTVYQALPDIDVSLLWVYWQEGDFIGFFYALMMTAFTLESIGVAFVVMLFLMPLYLRTGSLLLLCIAWILIGSFLIVLFPVVAGLAVLFMVLGISGLIYRLFRPANN